MTRKRTPRVRANPTGGCVLHTRLGHDVKRAARNREIDLALAVMCALQRPGECIPSRTIGEVTGMSHAGADFITKSALRKLRRIPQVRRFLAELAA